MPPAATSTTREHRYRLAFAGPLGGSLLMRVAAAGAAFALHALLARLAGADQYGTYSYVLACLGLTVLVATVGLDLSLVKYVAAYRARSDWAHLKGLVRWSRRTVLRGACLTAAVVALLLGLARRHIDTSLVVAAWTACGVLPVAAMLRLNEARLLGLGRAALAQLPDGVLRPAVTGAAALLAFWLPGRSLTSAGAMSLHLLASATAVALSLGLLRLAAPRPQFDVQARYDTRAWIRVSLPLWLEAGMRLLSASIDVVLLGALGGMAGAGIYAVANRCAELIVFGASASQAAARPYIAAAHAGADRPALQRTVTAAAGWATLFAIAACCVLVPARSILLRQFGDEFVAGSTALLILAAGYFVTACTALVDSVMNMTDRQRANARITAAVLALKLPLICLAIPHWGIVGAAAASSGSMIVGRLWSWTYVRRTLDIDGTVLGWLGRRRSR